MEIYEHFGCKNKRELLAKLRRKDESVKELLAFYEESHLEGSLKKRLNRDLAKNKEYTEVNLEKIGKFIEKNQLVPKPYTKIIVHLNAQDEVVDVAEYSGKEGYMEELTKPWSFRHIIIDSNWNSRLEPEEQLTIEAPILSKLVDKVCIREENDINNFYVQQMNKKNRWLYEMKEVKPHQLTDMEKNCGREQIILEGQYVRRKREMREGYEDTGEGDKIYDLCMDKELVPTAVERLNHRLSITNHVLRNLEGVGDVAKEYYLHQLDRQKLHIAKDDLKVMNHLVRALQHANYETVLAIRYDKQGIVAGVEELGKGSINQAAVNMKQLFQIGKKENTGGIIICHNHPSGYTSPSSADIETTKSILAMCKQLKINIADHYIVGYKETYRMSNHQDFRGLFDHSVKDKYERDMESQKKLQKEKKRGRTGGVTTRRKQSATMSR